MNLTGNLLNDLFFISSIKQLSDLRNQNRYDANQKKYKTLAGIILENEADAVRFQYI
jgi:hypothetical protein